MGGKEREWVVVGRGRRGSDGVICTVYRERWEREERIVISL